MSTVAVRGGRQRSSVAVLSLLRNWLGGLTNSSTPLLPFIPKPVKLLLLILFVFNSPSWPFLWHVRLWYYPLKAYQELYTKGRKNYIDDFEEKSQKAGGIRLITRNKRTAWVDDCDYNMHLSNSCYAKNADASRMKWCIEAMAPIFTPKCHMAMGGSHYIFVKEIPIGSEYVMESKLGGWDDKWIYLITEFIIYPKKGSSVKSKAKAVKPDAEPTGPAIPVISAPPSGTNSPSTGSGSNTPPTSEAVKKAATLRSRAPRADGGVVCTVVVTEYCVKAGRITVPPRIAWHFSMLSKDQSKRDHARNLLFGSKDQGRAWIRGGWKNEPNADTLGFDIGHDLGDAEIKEEAEWITTARDGMTKVNEGLSVF